MKLCDWTKLGQKLCFSVAALSERLGAAEQQLKRVKGQKVSKINIFRIYLSFFQPIILEKLWRALIIF